MTTGAGRWYNTSKTKFLCERLHYLVNHPISFLFVFNNALWDDDIYNCKWKSKLNVSVFHSRDNLTLENNDNKLQWKLRGHMEPEH